MDIIPTRSLSIVPTFKFRPSYQQPFSPELRQTNPTIKKKHKFIKTKNKLEPNLEDSFSKLDSTHLGKIRAVKAKVVKMKQKRVPLTIVEEILQNTAQRINEVGNITIDEESSYLERDNEGKSGSNTSMRHINGSLEDSKYGSREKERS